jgi:hypothetical protein
MLHASSTACTALLIAWAIASRRSAFCSSEWVSPSTHLRHASLRVSRSNRHPERKIASARPSWAWADVRSFSKPLDATGVLVRASSVTSSRVRRVTPDVGDDTGRRRANDRESMKRAAFARGAWTPANASLIDRPKTSTSQSTTSTCAANAAVSNLTISCHPFVARKAHSAKRPPRASKPAPFQQNLPHPDIRDDDFPRGSESGTRINKRGKQRNRL